MLLSKRPILLFIGFFCLIILTIVAYCNEKYIIGNKSAKNNDHFDVIHDQNDEFVKVADQSIGLRPVNQEYQRKLCESDKTSTDTLKAFNVSLVKKIFNSKTVTNYVNDFFHEFVQNPHRSSCTNIQKFGGQYNSACKFTDGSKFVCMDDVIKDIANGKCLIYSFGVAEDWSFEDIMDDLGCEVFAFDGSVEYPERRGNNIHFEKVMVGFQDNKAKNTKSLSTILKEHGHAQTKISYLKMDIEGNERTSLPFWLKFGALNNVQQIGMEFHLDANLVRTNKFVRTLRDLYFRGNYRLISYEANGCAKNTDGGSRWEYFYLAEIVLKKITNNGKCL